MGQRAEHDHNHDDQHNHICGLHCSVYGCRYDRARHDDIHDDDQHLIYVHDEHYDDHCVDDAHPGDFIVVFDYVVHYDGCSHDIDDDDNCPHDHSVNYEHNRVAGGDDQHNIGTVYLTADSRIVAIDYDDDDSVYIDITSPDNFDDILVDNHLHAPSRYVNVDDIFVFDDGTTRLN